MPFYTKESASACLGFSPGHVVNILEVAGQVGDTVVFAATQPALVHTPIQLGLKSEEEF